jgi:nicotinate-nucleotide adenylyltransferase
VTERARAIGVLGGTFDPIHFGHLRLGQELADCAQMSAVRFLPAGLPWQRTPPVADGAQRMAMVRRAIDGNPLFAADDRELARQGPSYAVDTLTQLREEQGRGQPICLLLGADAFLNLPTWKDWRGVFALAHVMVGHRPGHRVESAAMSADLRQEFAQRHTQDPLRTSATPCGGIFTLAMTPLEISASHIRTLLRTGASARYLLPDAVLDYIQAHGLYSGG